MEPLDTPQHTHDDGRAAASVLRRRQRRLGAVLIAGVVAARCRWSASSPCSCGSSLDPHFENYRPTSSCSGSSAAFAFVLGYTAGEAAKRRGDARVLLLSLAFMATGGFLGLHALGTAGVLFTNEHAGFQVAIPVGLLVSAIFAVGSAFVDARPWFAPALIRYRTLLHAAVLLAMGGWFIWTVLDLPPLRQPSSEAATGDILTSLAVAGTMMYALSAVRYWRIFRHDRKLLPAAVIACFLLLAEAMIGVAVTGERKWHASWWEWHGLIITAFVTIGLAARREWSEERFRDLYLSTTRERRQDISVLFADLVGFTAFTERSTPGEVAEVLGAYWGIAAPLITHEFGGEVEKFIGDGDDGGLQQPRRPARPCGARGTCGAGAATGVAALAERTSGLAADARRRQQRRGGRARGRRTRTCRVPAVGDAVNTGSRLESSRRREAS